MLLHRNGSEYIFDVQICLFLYSIFIFPGDMIKRRQIIILTSRATGEYYPRTWKSVLFIDCSVNGQSVRAILDTGSPNSFLSESFAEQAGHEVYP